MKKPMKILLLEDSHLDAEIIQRLLINEVSHCEFKLAMNKKAFLSALDEFTPDVILSDNSLPRFSATEALKIVRERSLQVPFILITGTVSEEYAAGIIKQGADDYILKDRMARLPGAIDAAVRVRKIEREKQEAAEGLKYSEENYRAIMERLSDAFVAMDRNWVYTYVNKAAGEIMHRKPDELVGKCIWTEFPEGIGLPFHTAYLKAMEDQRYIYLEEYFQPLDVWLENHIYPSPDGLSVFFRDITEKKLAEQQAEFDHNNLTALINNTRDLMWSVDRSFRVITFNQAFGDVIKLMSGIVLEKGADILTAAFNNEQLERYKNYYERAFAGEMFTEIEYNSLPVEFWSEISFYPIYEKRVVVGTACFSRDITDRKKSEEKLRQLAQEKLENKIQEQKRITRVMLITQEKERNAIGTELHDNVNQILVGTNLMLSMVKGDPIKHQNLLASSIEQIRDAIEENRKIAHVFVAPELEKESLLGQLDKLASNMLETIGIEVIFDAGRLREDSLDNDRKFNIYRIAQEQCTNIVKYAQAKTVRILLLTTEDSFQMTISDDGTGMDASKKSKGIGLRNIRNRLDLFDGTVAINTGISKGFSLEISMPLANKS